MENNTKKGATLMAIALTLSASLASAAITLSERTTISSVTFLQTTNFSSLPGVLVGDGFEGAIGLLDDSGATIPTIQFKFQLLTNDGEPPLASDFTVQRYVSSFDDAALTFVNQPTKAAAVFSVNFDGIDTFTFTVNNPIPSAIGPGGSFYGFNVSAPLTKAGEEFMLVSVPEPAAAVLGSIGLLTLLRRRRF